MELFTQFLHNFWNFLNLISIYLLFGLFIAGVLKQVIPDSFIKKHIGKNSSGSIFKAAILGTPLPLCSCSVIPFATSLKKSGASKSALQTFLISTPITGVDSILATYGAFGWFFTLYRLISSVLIALLAGFLSLIFIKEKEKSTSFTWQTTKPKVAAKTPTASCCSSSANKKKGSFLYRAYDYAFNQLFSDIAKSLLIGITLGALLTTFIPKDMTALLSDNLLISYLFVIALSAPLYVCAITSIPIGISLILTGFSPGTAFVFLTAGPATNLVTVSVVQKILGKKAMVIYLSSVVLGSIFFATLMDNFFLDSLASITTAMEADESLSGLDTLSSILMMILFFQYLKPKGVKKSCCS